MRAFAVTSPAPVSARLGPAVDVVFDRLVGQRSWCGHLRARLVERLAFEPLLVGPVEEAAGFLEASDDGGDGREPVAAVVFVDDGRHGSPHSCVSAFGTENHEASKRRGPCAMGRTWRSPWCGSSPDAGNSMWGAGNLETGAPSGPFVSGRTHQIELVAYGFLKVALPSHSDRIADITAGPSCAQERSFAGPQSNRRNRPKAEVRSTAAMRQGTKPLAR